jgi:uncharacterized protein Yka (UPF0111/DUF47 family)
LVEFLPLLRADIFRYNKHLDEASNNRSSYFLLLAWRAEKQKNLQDACIPFVRIIVQVFEGLQKYYIRIANNNAQPTIANTVASLAVLHSARFRALSPTRL